MKHSALWVTGGMLCLSIITMFDYADHPQRWRFYVMAITSFILCLFLIVGVISAVRKKRKG